MRKQPSLVNDALATGPGLVGPAALQAKPWASVGLPSCGAGTQVIWDMGNGKTVTNVNTGGCRP